MYLTYLWFVVVWFCKCGFQAHFNCSCVLFLKESLWRLPRDWPKHAADHNALNYTYKIKANFFICDTIFARNMEHTKLWIVSWKRRRRKRSWPTWGTVAIFCGCTEENTESCQPAKAFFEPRFEPGTFRIRSRCTTHLTVTMDSGPLK